MKNMLEPTCLDSLEMSVSTRLKKSVRPIHKGRRPSAASTKGGALRPPPFVEPFVDGSDRFFRMCEDTHVPTCPDKLVPTCFPYTFEN